MVHVGSSAQRAAVLDERVERCSLSQATPKVVPVRQVTSPAGIWKPISRDYRRSPKSSKDQQTYEESVSGHRGGTGERLTEQPARF